MGTSVFHEEIENELWEATSHGKTDEIERMLSTFMVDIKCPWGSILHTLLYQAATEGYKDVVKLLLDKWADPNVKDINNQETPLHSTVARRGHKDIAQFLLEKGGDPNLAIEFGWAPLHLATNYGKYDV